MNGFLGTLDDLIGDGYQYGVQSLLADGTVKLTSWHQDEGEARTLLGMLSAALSSNMPTDVASARLVRFPISAIEVVKE